MNLRRAGVLALAGVTTLVVLGVGTEAAARAVVRHEISAGIATRAPELGPVTVSLPSGAITPGLLRRHLDEVTVSAPDAGHGSLKHVDVTAVVSDVSLQTRRAASVVAVATVPAASVGAALGGQGSVRDGHLVLTGVDGLPAEVEVSLSAVDGKLRWAPVSASVLGLQLPGSVVSALGDSSSGPLASLGAGLDVSALLGAPTTVESVTVDEAGVHVSLRATDVDLGA